MSKNFELLQQLGNDEELFRTAVESQETAQSAEFMPGFALDKESFEKLMEKASLPAPFQTSNEPPQSTLTEPPELGSDRRVESASRKAPGDTGPEVFRTSRNPTSPIDDLRTTTETRLKQSPAKTASPSRASRTNGRPKVPPSTPSEEPRVDAKRVIQQRTYQGRSLSFPWLDSLKRAAKRWEWNKGVRSNDSGADLDAITRGEEIKLVQRVFPGTEPDSPRVAVFAGLGGEIGCARTCARIAKLLAGRAEGPVCVVDANFQAPTLHEYFGVDNLIGLAEATVESCPVQNFAQQVPEPDLWLIPSGKAAAQLRFPAMADGLRARIEELREAFRYVVIHSGPLRMETSAVLLSRWTDGVVLVVEANATRRDAARRAKEMLDAANVKLLGVVLNNRTFPIPEAIYRRLC